MRRIAVLVLFSGIAFPAAWGKPPVTRLVTVAQLEQVIAGARGASDGATAKQLSGVRLTERLSNGRLMQLDGQMPGRQSREQLLVVADESAFLTLPAEDQIADPIPDAEAQAAMLARTGAYFKEKMAEWPSFSALRAVTRFEGTATVIASGLQDDLGTRMGTELFRSPAAPNWECPGAPRWPSKRVDVIERATRPVIYRRGRAVHAYSTAGEFACMRRGLNTADEFSEFHTLVPVVARKGKAAWSHWEDSAEGKIAVFRFSVVVDYTGTSAEDSRVMDLQGEIGVNPRDGSVVRLAAVRHWERNSVTREYDTVVEFGAITMAGVRLLLPVRRVAMFLTPILKPATGNKTMAGYYRKFHLETSPLQEYLNDVRFGEYRAYGSLEVDGAAGTAVAADRR